MLKMLLVGEFENFKAAVVLLDNCRSRWTAIPSRDTNDSCNKPEIMSSRTATDALCEDPPFMIRQLLGGEWTKDRLM